MRVATYPHRGFNINARRWLCAIIVWLLSIPCKMPIATSAEIREVGRSLCQFALSGTIEAGDLEKLVALLQKSPAGRKPKAICLNSSGGAFDEGIKIGEYLSDHLISTRLDDGASCLSACAIIFMYGGYGYAGSGRAMHVNAQLGFHAPYLDLQSHGGLGASYSLETVEHAYAAATAEIGKLMQLSAVEFKQSGNQWNSLFPPRLLAEMLKSGKDVFFYINTVERAIMAGIDLVGYEMVQEPSLSTYINLCEHAYVHTFGERGWRNVEAGKPYVGNITFHGFEKTIECIAPKTFRLDEYGNFDEAGVYFEDHDGAKINEYGYGPDLVTPPWYVYNSTVALACLSKNSSADCKTDRTRAIPSADYCADHLSDQTCPTFLGTLMVSSKPFSSEGPESAVLATSSTIDRLTNIAFRYGGEESQTAASYELCAEKCRSNSDCNALTYFKDRHLCRLMSAPADQVQDFNADSGIKRSEAH